MRRAWRFFQDDWLLVLGALGLLVLGIGANLVKPWPLALLVDSVFGPHPLPPRLRHWIGAGPQAGLVAVLAGLVLALHAAQGALTAAQNYLAIAAGLRGLRRVRNEVFARLQRLSLRFHQGTQSGDTIYRATWDTYAFQTLFQQGFMTFCTAGLSLLLMVIVMWRLDGPLTLVAVGTAPLLFLVMRVFGREMQSRGMAAQQADSRVASLVQQCLAALPLIQSYGQEPLLLHRFGAQTAEAQHRRLRQHGAELVYWLAVSLVFAVGTAAIIGLGSHQVLAGKLTVGQLLIFLAYLSQLYDPLNQLSHVGATLSLAASGTQRVFAILDTPEEVREAPDALPLEPPGAGEAQPSAPQGACPPVADQSSSSPRRQGGRAAGLEGGLVLDSVWFGYQPEQPVLRGVSLRVPLGTTAALIGPSGAGKSTLLQLLPRFYDPAKGSVSWNGVDLRRLRLADLRRQIALVMQEPILLPGTVAENIACGQTASSEAIAAAARAAQAEPFIQRLPQGYQTVIGEGAARLSLGEKQRLNLARAFLKDAPILVLDEPATALDAESEAFVATALARLRQGRTVLVASHRPWLLGHLDMILVLDQGRVVETGAPAALEANPASYYARIRACGGAPDPPVSAP